jgi:hypothetical protein
MEGNTNKPVVEKIMMRFAELLVGADPLGAFQLCSGVTLKGAEGPVLHVNQAVRLCSNQVAAIRDAKVMAAAALLFPNTTVAAARKLDGSCCKLLDFFRALEKLCLRESGLRKLAVDSLSLKEIDLSYSERLLSCAGLAKCRGLTTLSLKGCRSMHFCGKRLPHFPELKRLSLSETSISSLEAIAHLQSLRALHISRCHFLRDTSLLATMPLLEIVDISCCEALQSLGDVGCVESLYWINIHDCLALSASEAGRAWKKIAGRHETHMSFLWPSRAMADAWLEESDGGDMELKYLMAAAKRIALPALAAMSSQLNDEAAARKSLQFSLDWELPGKRLALIKRRLAELQHLHEPGYNAFEDAVLNAKLSARDCGAW